MAKASVEEIIAMIERSELRLAEGETAEDVARLKASFPTPRAAVDYIMDTLPIDRRKDEEKFNGDYPPLLILETYERMRHTINLVVAHRTSEAVASQEP